MRPAFEPARSASLVPGAQRVETGGVVVLGLTSEPWSVDGGADRGRMSPQGGVVGDTWETFQLIRNFNGTVSLRAHANNERYSEAIINHK